MLGISMELLTLWHQPPRTIFTMSPADYYFPFLPLRSGKLTPPDLPIYELLYPPTNCNPRIDKTSSPLGWYGPSYGPPSPSRHGGGTSDSVFAHWIKRSYENLYSAKPLHCTSKVIKLARKLSSPSPGGASQHESQSEHEVDFLTHS